MFIGSLNEVMQAVLTRMLVGEAQDGTDAEADVEAGVEAKQISPHWDAHRQAWVLSPSRALLSFLWVVLLVGGVTAGVMSAAGVSLWLVCPMGLIAILAGVGLLLWRKSVLVIDRMSIVSRPMLGLRAITMCHDEVVDVRYSHLLRSFILIDESGQRVYFSTWISGVRKVLDEMAIRDHHLRLAAASQF